MLLQVIPALLNDLPSVENMIDTLPRHRTKTYPKRSMDQVTEFIVHHMASEAPLVNQANYHVNTKGWAGLGYHIVIWKDRIIQANPLDVVSNHCSGHNPQSIGVSILGDLSKRPITDLERKLVAGVLASLNAMLPGRKILGHNECVATTCPATSMDQIRQDVKELELRLTLEDSANDRLARAVKVAGRVNDLYSIASKPGKYQDEAFRKLFIIEDAMKKAGILG